jgi:oligopeptide transport system substrate-binding protein
MRASYRCATHKVRAFVSIAGLLMIFVVASACDGNDQKAAPKIGVLRMALTGEPNVDPAKVFDPGSETLAFALFDSLTKLDNDLQPVSNAAQTWDVSPNGRVVTFHLRGDLRWTNGDPVTAHDYEFSWKRALSAQIGSGYAYQLLGIAGAEPFSACKSDCEALQDRLGIRALDDRTLQVRLVSPQPWFVAQTAHPVFLPVHRATVEKYGDAWTEPAHIVTNGPFRLSAWKHNDSLMLVRNQAWRRADTVAIKQVELSVITDPAAQLKAFESGKVDALDGITAGYAQQPRSEITRLRRRGELAVYPGLGIYYLGINLQTIRDPLQRRAMALAIDRASFGLKAGPVSFPATSFTPAGLPGYETIAPGYLDERARLSEAQALMRKVKNPKRAITLYQNEGDPSVRRYTPSIAEDWSRIGITTKVRILEWASFLEEIGPPLSGKVDVYGLGWAGDYPDATNFLGLWTCENTNNPTGYCNRRYDRALAAAARHRAAFERWKIYARMERELTGPDGAFPIIPMNWYYIANLEATSVGKTFNMVPPYGYADLSRVVVEGA